MITEVIILYSISFMQFFIPIISIIHLSLLLSRVLLLLKCEKLNTLSIAFIIIVFTTIGITKSYSSLFILSVHDYACGCSYNYVYAPMCVYECVHVHINAFACVCVCTCDCVCLCEYVGA